jgi:RNA polymerase sigma-70 factor (ECF subfamily)
LAAEPSPERDDAQLIAAVRAGDVASAGAFHDRLRPAVERTLNRLLGSADPDHPDLAQQAMIELVETIDRYRGECSVEGWAATITAHIVYKHIRRRRLERRIFAGGLTLASDERAPALPNVLALRGLVDRVAGHLEKLDRDRAFTLVLHDVHGYDLKEIASITRVTVSAAQTRLSRGRRELHARIAADPELAGALEAAGGGDT